LVALDAVSAMENGANEFDNFLRSQLKK
jgi:hypothetical protein